MSEATLILESTLTPMPHQAGRGTLVTVAVSGANPPRTVIRVRSKISEKQSIVGTRGCWQTFCRPFRPRLSWRGRPRPESRGDWQAPPI